MAPGAHPELALFVSSTLHLLSAGTDARRLLPVAAATAVGTFVIFAGVLAWTLRLAAREPAPR